MMKVLTFCLMTIVACTRTLDAMALREEYKKEVVIQMTRVQGLIDPKLSEEARAYVYSRENPRTHPEKMRVDRSGNIYLLFLEPLVIRKYDPKGRYVGTYRWTWARKDSSVRDFQVDEQENIYILDDNPQVSNIIRVFSKEGELKHIDVGRRTSRLELLIGNGLIMTREGEVLKRLSRSATGTDTGRNIWRGGRFDDRENPLGGIYDLVGPTGKKMTLDARLISISPRINRGWVKALDKWENFYAVFAAPDPTVVYGLGYGGRTRTGSRYYIGKYSRDGELLAWFKMEIAPVGPDMDINENGDVYQLWASLEVPTRITRWSRIR